MSAPPRRFLSVAAALVLAVTCFPPRRSPGADQATPPDRPQTNPEYASWAALKEGAWVRLRVSSNTRNVERTSKLVKVTPDGVRLEETEAGPGEPPGEPHERVVPAKPADKPKSKPAPAKADEEGDEKVPVANVELSCHWQTHGKPKPGEKPEAGDTVWVCPGVPGFVKKVSWLPADPDLGLPEVRATEMLVAFDLPARDQGEGEGRGQKAEGRGDRKDADPTATPQALRGSHGLPVHAEPPGKFSWTYHFDPPGWRHWSRLDAGTWEEKWESGESLRAHVTGWIADGERLGTLVRREDNAVETVIPDAGKGAIIWFRKLPGGKWLQLGTVEESE